MGVQHIHIYIVGKTDKGRFFGVIICFWCNIAATPELECDVYLGNGNPCNLIFSTLKIQGWALHVDCTKTLFFARYILYYN